MKKRLLNFFIILSSAVVLIVLLFFTNGIQDLVKLLENIKYQWIAAASLCMLLYWIMDASVIHTVLQALVKRQQFWKSFKVSMIGMFFNSVTPLASGGQPAQVYAMTRDGIGVGSAVSILVIKAISYQLVLFIYTLVMFVSAASFFIQRIPHFLVLYIIGAMVNLFVISMYVLFLLKKEVAEKILVVALKFLRKLRLVKNPEKLHDKLEAELDSFNAGASILRNKRLVVIKTLIFQVMQFTFLFTIPYFINLAIELEHASFLKMLSAQSLSTMITALVPTPGSAGGAEGLSYLFFSLFFRPSVIIPVILIWRIITYYYNIIFGGLVSMLVRKKSV